MRNSFIPNNKRRDNLFKIFERENNRNLANIYVTTDIGKEEDKIYFFNKSFCRTDKYLVNMIRFFESNNIKVRRTQEKTETLNIFENRLKDLSFTDAFNFSNNLLSRIQSSQTKKRS